LEVKLQLTVPSPHDGRDDSPMVRGMEPRLPKRHIAKKLCVLAPSHTVVWLGLMSMYPSLLPPSPPCSLSLLLATSLDIFSGHVDEVYSFLFEDMLKCLLPIERKWVVRTMSEPRRKGNNRSKATLSGPGTQDYGERIHTGLSLQTVLDPTIRPRCFNRCRKSSRKKMKIKNQCATLVTPHLA
jgi:hypothetical protein